MAVRPVIALPDARLKRLSAPVGRVDDAALALAADLVDTMRSSPACVGLAAPQIGVNVRAFVVDVSGHRKARSCHGEDVVLDLRPHWWFLAGPTAAVVVAVVLAVVVATKSWPDWAVLATLGLLIVAVAWFLARYARWATTNFVVTTDRLVFRSGVLAKQGKEIPLERVNDIAFRQSIFERIIGAGDLMIESAGERGQETFTDIPRPARVQNEIYRQMELTQSRAADRVAGRRELSVPEQLEKLDELRQRGIISQAEFDAKKAQLLDRM